MLPIALLGLLAACGGDKDPPATGATGETAATGDTGEAGAPTFSRLRDPLKGTCGVTGCHATPTDDNGGFALVDGEEYERLVNAPSAFAQGEILVVPGDADGSYVIKKIEGSPDIVGERMPPPLGTIDPRLLADLRAWIDAGALDN